MVAAAALALLFACAPDAGQEPAIRLDVPFFSQTEEGCGAACIAMVFEFWGATRPDQAAVMAQLFSPQARGIPADAMEHYFRANGFHTFAFRGNWVDLDRHLSKGRPLIVCLKGSARAPYHYVVVGGIDRQNQLILINDPAVRKLLKMHKSDFEKSWLASGNWTLLAVPQHGN
jgi:ABC-type bacteriocin/lantibiotic exporter with double-glycine peptidase domain